MNKDEKYINDLIKAKSELKGAQDKNVALENLLDQAIFVISYHMDLMPELKFIKKSQANKVIYDHSMDFIQSYSKECGVQNNNEEEVSRFIKKKHMDFMGRSLEGLIKKM